MRQALRARARFVGSVVCAAPVLVFALTACLPEGGYDKVTHREQDELPTPAYPEPPRVIAGVGQDEPGEYIEYLTEHRDAIRSQAAGQDRLDSVSVRADPLRV